MHIDPSKCRGCGQCFNYCPVQAHYFTRFETGQVYAVIDQDKCTECGICLRSGICSADAIYQVELTFPRNIRAILSDPLIEFTGSNVPGRGTAEIKTNEITGRVKWGRAGLALEMGRPGIGVKWVDVQKVTMALAKLGVEFCEENPVTYFMKDRRKGELQDEVLGERSISAIIEFDCTINDLPKILKTIKEVTKEIDTVYSFPFALKLLPGGQVPAEPIKMVMDAGYTLSMNSKNNMGLGRPRFREEGEV